MEGSHQTFITQINQTTYSKTTVQLTSSANQTALYLVQSSAPWKNSFSSWLLILSTEENDFLLIRLITDHKSKAASLSTQRSIINIGLAFQ